MKSIQIKSTSISLVLLALGFANVMAQAPDDPGVDENDVNVRENPIIDGSDDDFDLTVPSFINENANHIEYNGANWTELRKALSRAEHTPFTILHIGDSHIQADYATGEVRDYLQFDYGNAGRGLITPLRMSGSNQPDDYFFSSPQKWSAVKLMGQNWPRTMGFTGTSVSPSALSGNFSVTTSEKDDYDPFNTITVFHKGQFFVTSVADGAGNLIPFTADPSQDYTHIRLTKDVTTARINFDSAGDLTLFGVSLSGHRPGLFYHTIGNNGATYDTYNRIGTMGDGIAPLQPDLIIISLGTNEAFGKLNTSGLTHSINRLVNNIKKSNPMAQILLVTPMECQRSSYTKSKRRGKRRAKTVKGYTVNNNIKPIRDAILQYGKDHGIATYDWYEVAGGSGASTKWINDGLFSKDRVHHSLKGYKLQGFMLYQALKSAFEK